jgi:6-phosphogluconolactonase (cycloisomerase 2 family)
MQTARSPLSRFALTLGRVLAPAGALSLLLLAGCGQFFPPLSSSSGSGSGSGGGTATGNNVYVLNTNPSAESVGALSLSDGTTTALSGSPYALNTPLTSMAINPAGSLLYVSSLLSGIYVYTISNGALTLGSNSGLVGNSGANAMTVDPTGQWLLGVTNTNGGAPVLTSYSINSTTGALTTGSSIGLDTGAATQIVFSPESNEAFIPLGTGGIDAITLDSGTGALTKLSVLVQPQGNASADQAVAVNPAGTFLFAAETGTSGVRVFSIASSGTLSEVSGSPYATALGPKAVLVDSTGSYVYVANSTPGTLSAFAIGSTGALTQISGSPFSAGSAPVSLAEDTMNGYLEVACSGGSPDLEVFSIGTSASTVPGALTSSSTASTASVSPAVATQVVSTP